MNKDVIYIEPEDDITDIISKLENSKEKIVALVPPQKAGVLRSTINLKLLTKSASNSQKTLVLVTTDPSIIKLAALIRIPVTKDLQSAPSIPTLNESSEPSNIKEELIEEKPEESEKPLEDSAVDSSEKTSPKSKKTSNHKIFLPEKFTEWFQDHKKLIIILSSAIFIFIVTLIWAFVIAPAVSISVTIKTTSGNFSENISLVSDLSSEDAQKGIFFYEKKEKKSEQKTTFTATGSKNNGAKATGTLVVYASFPIYARTGSTSIPQNTAFTFNGLKYYTTEAVSLTWDGSFSSCDNAGSILTSGALCTISASVPAIAEEPGTSYNVSASTSGWSSSISSAEAYAKTDFTGGTDDIITVVTQSDIDKAKEELTTTGHSKEAFLDELSENESLFIVSQSYKENDVEYISSPAIGEEVKKDVEPTLTATITESVLVVDKTKIEEFISEKAKLGDDQKIYAIKDPFIESFTEKENGYAGKLKTSFTSGSKITEEEILEKVKGKKVGEVKAILSSISGVAKDSTKIETSFFWVSSVPEDPNKITINLTVE